MAVKYLLFALFGLIATSLAIVGVWLPGLPTTPFLLLALWAFSRSNSRFSVWLRRISLLRKAIEVADSYQQDYTLPLRLKVIAQSFAWASVPVVFFVTRNFWISAIVVIAATSCTIFMILTPSSKAKVGSIKN